MIALYLDFSRAYDRKQSWTCDETPGEEVECPLIPCEAATRSDVGQGSCALAASESRIDGA